MQAEDAGIRAAAVEAEEAREVEGRVNSSLGGHFCGEEQWVLFMVEGREE